MSASTEMLKGIFRSLAAIVLAVFAYLGVYLSLDVRWWIDVQDISVVNSGENVIAAREIKRDFSGAYIVTIRAVDGRPVCSTGEQHVEYDDTARLPEPMTLQYWAFGGTCTELLKNPLKDGAYTMTTCHRVLRPFEVFPTIQRCVSTAFQVPDQINSAQKGG